MKNAFSAMLVSVFVVACGSSSSGGGNSITSGDACDDDLASLAAMTDTIFGDSTACGISCIAAEDRAACSGECVVEETSISEPCGVCFGNLIDCILDECIAMCIDQASEECTTCIAESTCDPAFVACTGFSSNVNAGACGADLSILTSMLDTITETTGSCGVDCALNEDISMCGGDCVVEATGISAECGVCFGDLIECSVTMCAADCAGDPGSEDCGSCLETMGCNAGYTACAGFPPSAGS